jgi:hypothetical protein
MSCFAYFAIAVIVLLALAVVWLVVRERQLGRTTPSAIVDNVKEHEAAIAAGVKAAIEEYNKQRKQA